MNKTLARLKKIKESITTLAPSAWSDPDLVDGLIEVFALEQRLAALRLAMVNEIVARKVPAQHGATSGAAWFGGLLRVSHYAAGKMIRLAKSLSGATRDTAEALAAGCVNVDQADVIVHAVDSLPDAFRQQGEARMLGLAAELNSAQLRKASVDLHEQVDPDGARRQRKERARRSSALRGIHLSPVDGDEMVHLHGRMESATADIVRAALDSAHVPDDPGGLAQPLLTLVDSRTPDARRLDALKHICLQVIAERTAPINNQPAAPASRRRPGRESARTERRRSRRQQRNQTKKRPPVGVPRPEGARGRQGAGG